MNDKTIAVMPIKLNNERLPGKNIMLLNNKPLLSYQLEAMLRAQVADEICVFCSNDSIKQYLPSGVTFIKRDLKLDLPTSNFTQIFQAFMKERKADIYLYFHATAPFISVESIRKCYRAVQSGLFDSAFCARKIQDFLWKDNMPMNFDAASLPRSQDLDPIYRETSGVYVFKRSVFEKTRRRIGDNPYIHEVTWKESIDINEPEDFLLAQLCFNQGEGMNE